MWPGVFPLLLCTWVSSSASSRRIFVDLREILCVKYMVFWGLYWHIIHCLLFLVGIWFSFCCMVWKYYVTTVFDKRHSPVEGCCLCWPVLLGEMQLHVPGEMPGTNSASFLGGSVGIGQEMKTQVTAGWGNLAYLFHLYIIDHIPQEFLGCINTAQDCLSGPREWVVFYFNGRSRLLVTALWKPRSDLTFLRLSTSCDQRWDAGRKKVGWAGSWQLVHPWNQLVTSWRRAAHLSDSQTPRMWVPGEMCVFSAFTSSAPACSWLQ